jgi:hypothetical protein
LNTAVIALHGYFTFTEKFAVYLFIAVIQDYIAIVNIYFCVLRFFVWKKIRLKIYSKFFVYSEFIIFVADDDLPLPSLFQFKRDDLYPVFLRVNKKIHSEANLFFYFNNRFRFSDIFTSIPSAIYNSYIAPFLR